MFKKGDSVKWYCDATYEWFEGVIIEVASVDIDEEVCVLYRVNVNGENPRWASEEQLRVL